MKLLPLLLAAFAVTSPAFTQAITMVGRVERQTTGCNPTASYKVSCSRTQLVSTAVDLSAYVNQIVQIDGTADLTNPACPVVDVATVAATTATTRIIALRGSALGSPLIFTTTVPVGALVGYVFSTDSGLLPLGTFGALQLDLPGSVFWTFDVSIGVAIRSVTIPRDSFLIGVDILFQTVAVTVTPTFGAQLLNLNCFTITQ